MDLAARGSWLDRTTVGSIIIFILFFIGILAFSQFSHFWQGSEQQERIFAAILGALGTLVSAIVGVLLFNWQRQAGEQEKIFDKQEFRRNLAAALRAEISESLEKWETAFDPDRIEEDLNMDRQNLENASDEQNGMPMGVPNIGNPIFDAHKDQILELPEAVIRLVTRYYQNDFHFNSYLLSVVDGKFSNLTSERQRKAILNLRALGFDALYSGLRAKAVLDAHLSGYYKVGFASIKVTDASITDKKLAKFLDQKEDQHKLLLKIANMDEEAVYASWKNAIGLK